MSHEQTFDMLLDEFEMTGDDMLLDLMGEAWDAMEELEQMEDELGDDELGEDELGEDD